MAILAALAITATTAVSVSAAPVRVTPSQITLKALFKGGNGTKERGGIATLPFGGKVKAARAKCRRNRNVVLFFGTFDFQNQNRGVAGRRAPKGFRAVAVTKTNRRGAWRILEPAVPFFWDGRVVARVTRHRGDRARCSSARSEVITITA